MARKKKTKKTPNHFGTNTLKRNKRRIVEAELALNKGKKQSSLGSAAKAFQKERAAKIKKVIEKENKLKKRHTRRGKAGDFLNPFFKRKKK